MKIIDHIQFQKDYIDALLFAELDDEGEPLDKNFEAEDLADVAVIRIEQDCYKFIKKAAAFLETSDPHPGHDFWLTRNGHGAGFWDGDYEPRERGDKLTEICKEFGECQPYVGDDKLIYFN